MKKIIELLRVYFLDRVRRPLTVVISLVWILGFFVFLYFVFEKGGLSFGSSGNFGTSFIASYLVFIPAYMSIFGLLNGLISDSEKGMLKAYRSSRLRKYEYFAAKIVAVSISSLVVAAILVGLGSYFMGISLPPGLVTLAVLMTVVAHSGIAFITASLSKDTQESQMVVQTFVIVLIAGTPVFYPAEMLPGPLRLLQQLIPLTHSIELVRAMVHGAASTGFLAEKFAILSGFSLALLGVAYRRFRF